MRQWGDVSPNSLKEQAPLRSQVTQGVQPPRVDRMPHTDPSLAPRTPPRAEDTYRRKSKATGKAGHQLPLVEAAGLAAWSLSTEFQHLLHHGPDPVVDVVKLRLAHEGRGRDHLVFLVHVSFVHGSYGKTSPSKD